MLSHAEGRHMDRPLFRWLLACLALGLLTLAAASRLGEQPLAATPIGRQLLWTGLGLVLAGLILVFPLRLILKGVGPLYVLSLLALVLVLVMGRGPAGRWLMWGAFRIQPAELAKVATLLALASWLSVDQRGPLSAPMALGALALAGLPLLLVAVEPDLGTALVFAVLAVAMLWWRGLDGRWLAWAVLPLLGGLLGWVRIAWLAVLFLLAVLAVVKRRHRKTWLAVLLIVGLSGHYLPRVWVKLPAYQRSRVTLFLGMESDPRGSAYQVIQSKVAIGSGGVLGKGFGQGTQTQLRFLPEHHTDFIFSVLGEEFGFLGVAAALFCLGGLVMRLVLLAERHPWSWARLLFLGIGSIWGFQSVINMAMTVGWAPVTGLPLPFFSYGGSAMLTNLTLAALALKVSRR